MCSTKHRYLIEQKSSRFPLPAAEKAQYFDRLSFNSTLQLINDILRDLQKLLKYFNGTAIVAFLKIPLASFGLG